MANAATTQASSASETTGTPIPLAYGYVWATGKRAEYYMLQNTGSSYLDYTRVGIWLLGHGEWDGPSELWINDLLTLEGTVTPTTFGPSTTAPPGFSGQQWVGALDGGPALVFNFHSGTDATIGAGLTPSSSGPDQGVDVLFAQFPPAIQPLAYNRIAYYAIMRKQPIKNQTNDHRNDPSQWTDINPIGLWRALRCRLFDADGNMTGYAFTTNPAWHFVDVLLRRKLMPEYNITQSHGATDLTQAVRARFDWPSIYASAQYFDEILANGRRRFQGSYAFSSQTSLQAALEQILLCCRSFMSEYAGKIALKCDMPRSSVFTFSRQHILPGSFEAGDQTLHTAANRYIATFRDLLVPQCAAIQSITCTGNGRPVVTTTEPHPLMAGDRIAIGGTDTLYDGEWVVYSVPPVINPGTPSETDPTTFVVDSKGANYPTSVGAGGGVGLLYSRFALRSPEFWHKQNMLARGAVGLNIARIRNKVKQEFDYATSTYDQASRISRYERDRTLGLDVSPYVTPPFMKLRTSLFAMDGSGNLACAIQPGDHITVDDTVSVPYAGEYEVLDPLVVYPPTSQAASNDGSLVLTPAQESGEIEFSLGPYNEAVMYDDSDDQQAGWLSVPGSDPGNDSNYTGIDLASGNFVFFSGQLPTGNQFQLPSTGYPAGNMLAWASPASAVINYHSASTVQLCSVSADRILTLIYNDLGSVTWGGNVNYAALSWLSSDVPTVSNGITWLELTLLGGEKILFGQGVVADGTAIVLPAGYTTDKMFAVAFAHDMPHSSHIMYFCGAYVDASNVVHLDASDNTGHTWHGNAAVLVFAWQNNMGTVTTETVSGASWMEIVLSNGKKFGAGCQKGMANGSTFSVPAAAGTAASLQVIVGSSDGTYSSPSNHAQGIGSCYLDGSNVVHITFNDGSGDVWYGTADIFAIYCEPGTAAPTLVTVSPSSATLAQGATLQFTAAVAGNTNTSVTWSVDGVTGGSPTVGTIDSTGLYTAPFAEGTHTITATSVADGTAQGTAAVAVSAAGSSGGWTINGS